MLSADEFAEAALARIARTRPDLVLRARLPFGALFAAPDGTEWTVFFDRAYAVYSSDPGSVEQVLDRVGTDLVAPPSLSFERARPLLLPAPRSMAAVRRIREQGAQSGAPPEALPLFRSWVDPIVVGYQIDRPEDRVWVSPQDLADWSVSPERLDEAAMANLRARGDVRIVRSSPPESGPLLLLDPQDDFAAARLLLPEVRSALAKGWTNPDFAVAVPDTRTVVLAPASNPAGVAFLSDRVLPEKLKAAVHPLAAHLLRLSGSEGNLSPWNRA